MELSEAFVNYWSRRYIERQRQLETRLLQEIGPSMRERRYATPDELEAVATWKSKRSVGRVRLNTADDVAEVTAMAFSAPERLKHRTLTLLNGVGVPMASAILTVWDPTTYTVVDFRAREALKRLSTPTPGSGYYEYVLACRSLAAEHAGGDLRRFDQALWQWSKENYVPWPTAGSPDD